MFDYFEHKDGNPIIALPTGTGKSACIAGFMQAVLETWPFQRFMVMTHVKELIEQNYKTLLRMWPTAPAGIYSAGLKQRETRTSIVFGGVASVNGNVADFGHRDLLIIDEAHLLSPKDGTMYQRVIAEMKEINPYLKVIGLTATPYRLGQGMLTDDGLFTDICYNKTNMRGFNELLNAGFLSKLVTPGNIETELDVSGVKIDSTGDYKKNELQAAVDKKDVTHRALTELVKWGEHRKSWLIFASGIEHAQHISDMLNEWGIPTMAVHSKMGDGRDDAITDFKSGKLRCVVNNNVLTTGFDHPEMDMIGMLRPTVSPGLWVQMLGRLTRIHPNKKDGLVLDFAGNTKRLGPINDPVIPRKKGKKTGTAPIKVCPQCEVLVHASVRVCDNCGYEFPRYTKITREASNAELIRTEESTLPETVWCDVSGVYYSKHQKSGKPACIKVTYQCGLRTFSEFVFPEGVGNRFPKWWTERSAAPVPNSTEEFLQLMEFLNKPTEIRVWVNKKYPEVMNYKF